ncbi:MAG: zinc ribbon domain-containing protein [Chloroflexi bacterium]|jgi:hypothetical protein|nr:zinc ribbon domain-containing protein [Chloroflexota bacterium]MBT7080610.1 zinc ribbon domain-containing protein [Chloroflexota bacterium]MBT7289253.1 zinc ribbon domain-containing protein [Chloroflexota bacterium]
MTKIYRLLLLFVVIGLLSVSYAPLALAAPEDEPTGLSSVELRVYPEYDDPQELGGTQLLVFYRGQITGITASAADPATVRFLVPDAASMHTAGFFSTSGGYVRGGYVDPTKTIGDPFPETIESEIAGWHEITFTIESNSFVVAYYDPIIIGDTAKTIDYEFSFLYPIADLDIYVLQPRTSSEFDVEPSGTTITHNAWDGKYPAEYYSLTNLAVDEDSPIALDIEYIKSDPRPSVEIPAGSAGDGSTSPATAIVSIVMAIIIIGAIVIIVLRQKSRTKRRPTGKARTKVKRQKFCRQCGKQMDRSMPHCPYCGAKQK